MQFQELSEFGLILLFIAGGSVFIVLTLFAGKLLRPSRPNDEKLATYESGEDAVGNAWAMFNSRFYIIGLIFVLFEVEIVFLFPWATVFGQKQLIDETNGVWGWFSFFEMFFFILVLAIGLAYVWKKGYLNWEKSTPPEISEASDFRRALYDRVNNKYMTGSKDIK